MRVVDVSQALAGPFCTMLLADLGADVIKIEPPRGDIPRHQGPYMRGDSEHAYGAYFASVNRNKRGIVLDLNLAGDREVLFRLVDHGDVLVENFRAGVMERWGLAYETLHERNPKLVYGAIRGFGDPRTGKSPYSDWPAFDIVAQAMGGIVSMTGTADGECLRVGPSVGDLYPATLAALAITAAVVHAQATGEGQFVDVAMYDSIVALCESAVYRYSYMGFVTQPMGNSHPQLSPFDIYPTADGSVAVAAPTDSHWTKLCRLMGREDLVDDEHTRGNRERVRNADFVRDTMSEWTLVHTTAEIVGVLAGEVPVGPVNRAPDLFEDPHLRAREMLVAIEHPGGDRPGVFPNSPMRFTETPSGVYRPRTTTGRAR